MKRNRKARDPKADEQVLARIKALKAIHPAWGCRRIHAYLRRQLKAEGVKKPINHKRIRRLMQEANLLVPARQTKAPRTPTKSKPRPELPNECWGTDMTKILIPSYGWLYLHVVLDWGSKKLVGWHLSERSLTSDWKAALDMAVSMQFPAGIKDTADVNLSLVSDNGCQPTSTAYLAHCKALGIKQIFTSYNNPKGNADTERYMKTIKEDIVWPFEWTSPDDFRKALAQWFVDYNSKFPHSALKGQTPEEFEKWFYASSGQLKSTPSSLPGKPSPEPSVLRTA